MTIENIRTSSSVRLMMISIHPRYVAAILAGEKTVELRRLRPSVTTRQPVVIYATTPTAAIVATCCVSTVETGPPDEVWRRHHARTAITRTEFDRYFAGAHDAVALILEEVTPMVEVVTLGDLRRSGSFQPPRTWHFLDETRIESLFKGHPSEHKVKRLLPDRISHDPVIGPGNMSDAPKSVRLVT